MSFFLLSFLSLLLDIGMIGRDFGRGLHLGEGDKLGLGHSQIQKSGSLFAVLCDNVLNLGEF